MQKHIVVLTYCLLFIKAFYFIVSDIIYKKKKFNIHFLLVIFVVLNELIKVSNYLVLAF